MLRKIFVAYLSQQQRLARKSGSHDHPCNTEQIPFTFVTDHAVQRSCHGRASFHQDASASRAFTTSSFVSLGPALQNERLSARYTPIPRTRGKVPSGVERNKTSDKKTYLASRVIPQDLPRLATPTSRRGALPEAGYDPKKGHRSRSKAVITKIHC